MPVYATGDGGRLKLTPELASRYRAVAAVHRRRDCPCGRPGCLEWALAVGVLVWAGLTIAEEPV